MGGVTINVQIPVLDEDVPVRHRPAVAGLHPRRPPAHDRRRGARLRPVTPQRPGRLRPRRPPAAGADVAPRAGRHREPRPADPGARGALKATVRTDIPQAELAKLAGLAGSVDTKNIRSYVFTYPIATGRSRSQSTRELHHRAERRQDPGRGRQRLQGRPAARGSLREAFSRGGRVGLGPERLRQAGPGEQRRGLPRVLRPHRVGAGPEARRGPAGDADRRLQRRRRPS